VAPALDGPHVRLLRAELDLSDRFLTPKVERRSTAPWC
jgi:hypothetical protein